MFAVRGGSRVVQVTFTNHSNVSKPAFVISQVLYYSARNQLSFLFYCLLLNKTRKKALHLVIVSLTQQTQPFPSILASLRSRGFIVCWYSWEQCEKLCRHNRRKFVPSGWDWMVYGSCHKSLKTNFDWPKTLTLSCELLKPLILLLFGFPWLPQLRNLSIIR